MNAQALSRALDLPLREDFPYFFPFFFLEAPAPSPGVPASTRIPSSLGAVACDLSTSLSSSFMKSEEMAARRFSHHSFSASVFAVISSSFFWNIVFAAISLAVWKMLWPQLGARPLAWWGTKVGQHKANLSERLGG